MISKTCQLHDILVDLRNFVFYCVKTNIHEVGLSEKNIVKKETDTWYALLSSNRFAIYVLIILTVVCFIGVLVPQKGVVLSAMEYQQMIQNPVWKTLDRFGFLNVFSSIWFFFFLGLMLLNLALCSIKGIGRVSRRLEKQRRPLTADTLKIRGFFRIFNATDPEKTQKAVLETLGTLGKVRITPNNDGKDYYAESGAWARLAPFVIHASIFILFAGAIIDMAVGKDGKMNIPEGETIDIFQTFAGTGESERYRLPFGIRCDDFEIEFYPGTEKPKDYKSKLVVVRDNQDVYEKTIEVNDPMEFDGFRFFQSSYGQSDSTARLEIIRKSDGKTLVVSAYPNIFKATPAFDIALNNTQNPPLQGFLIVDAHSDMQGNGPAARIAAYRNGEEVGRFWIFLNAPDFDDMRNGPYKFIFKDIKTGYFTGIMVVRKPGASIIWAGCGMFFLAVMATFFVPYRRAWARFDGKELWIAGAVERSPGNSNERFAAVTKKLESRFGAPKDGSQI